MGLVSKERNGMFWQWSVLLSLSTARCSSITFAKQQPFPTSGLDCCPFVKMYVSQCMSLFFAVHIFPPDLFSHILYSVFWLFFLCFCPTFCIQRVSYTVCFMADI